MGGKLGWMRVFVTVTMLFVLFGPSIRPAEAIATRLFVKTTGSGTMCSQLAPCSLSTAVSKSLDGDNIYLAAGTYTGTGGAVISLTDKAPHIIGGWDGTTAVIIIGGMPFPIVDPQRHVTILDGQNFRRGVSFDGEGWPTNLTPSFVNLTITRGNATGKYVNCSSSYARGCGGGMFIHAASPTVANDRFIDNIALASGAGTDKGYGGAVYIENTGSTAYVRDNLFQDNYSDTVGNGGGGALAVVISSEQVNVIANHFQGNYAGSSGGGMYFDRSNISLASNTFTGNTANQGAGLYGLGASGTAWGNLFTANESMSGEKSSTVLLTTDTMSFVRNQLVENTADYGLYVDLSPDATVPFVNNIIAKSGSLSAVYIYLNSGYTGPSHVDFKHNTLVGTGGATGVIVTATCFASCLSVTMVNTILSSFNTGTQILNNFAGISADRTLFYNVSIHGDAVYAYYLTGNPRFVNASAGDYRIGPLSQARDHGIAAGVSDDIDNDSRPIGMLYDIGADEFGYHALLPVVRK